MFRQELPRFYELKDCISDPASPNAYFQNFDQNLAGSAHVKDVYLQWERELQGLDDTAWEHLRKEARPRLTAYDEHGRGWQQLFDILGEARAYNYLKSIGCRKLNFIPRSSRPTPDLEGLLGSDRVLCEVKTINISDAEAARRLNPKGTHSIQVNVASEFLKKLHATVENASRQMLAFDDPSTYLHFVYLNISFDDFFAEWKEAYFKQIDDELFKTPVKSVKLVICNEHTAFYKPLEMRFADVDNIGGRCRITDITTPPASSSPDSTSPPRLSPD